MWHKDKHQKCSKKLTNPLSGASRVSGATKLGADCTSNKVLLQLQVVIHAGHVQRRARQAKLNLDQGVSRSVALNNWRAAESVWMWSVYTLSLSYLGFDFAEASDHAFVAVDEYHVSLFRQSFQFNFHHIYKGNYRLRTKEQEQLFWSCLFGLEGMNT